ncbi:hypothetical protein MLD38_004370 [Melastoma candidum]|uniref:Uncharacterized protein n=1 Tax=Melastoma candidum TaxID=119954 RepID=A0ACB9S5U0_9MYRT|nr:hypothetical protein MLD38_004370 [Melastoma candidum]
MAVASTTSGDHRTVVTCPSISRPRRAPPSSFAVTRASFLRATPACRTRLSISRPVVPRRGSCRVCLLDSTLDDSPGSNPEDGCVNSSKSPSINLNLPRRSLLVQFTCNECGERTNRLVNKLALERGLVYVQCAGCQQYHKLVDNLGLVVDYKAKLAAASTMAVVNPISAHPDNPGQCALLCAGAVSSVVTDAATGGDGGLDAVGTGGATSGEGAVTGDFEGEKTGVDTGEAVGVNSGEEAVGVAAGEEAFGVGDFIGLVIGEFADVGGIMDEVAGGCTAAGGVTVEGGGNGKLEGGLYASSDGYLPDGIAQSYAIPAEELPSIE